MFGLATLTVAGLVSAGTAMARTDLPAGGKQASASLGTTDLSEAYAGDAAASDDRFQTTRTDWWVSSKVDAATLAQRVADNNARLTSLTVDAGSSPVTFTATMVRNTGAYARSWWWYVGQTAAQVNTLTTNNHARLITAEKYWTGSDWRYAVVMVANPTSTPWGWWDGDATYINTQASNHNFRIIRLQSYVASGAKRFVAVMVTNTGLTAVPWWGWRYNVALGNVGQYLSANNATLLDIRRNDDGTFDILMARRPPGAWQIWWLGQELPGLLDRAAINGARLITLQSFVGGGKTLYVGVLTANLDPRTQAQQILKAGTDALAAHGATGAVAQLSDPVFGTISASSGVADRSTSIPVDPAAHFRIASLSKAFVATLVLKLEAQGKLKITDSVERWLPGLVPNGADITLTQLLNHSSGLYNYTDSPRLPPFLSTMDQAFTPEQLVALAVDNPPYFAPGAGYHYSNTNYVLLAMVIEKATGQPYGQQLDEQILQPLHLSGTSVPNDGDMAVPLLRGYVTSSGTVYDTTAQNPTRWYGPGQVVSTPADVNTFTSALLAGQVLPAAQLAELKNNRVAIDATHEYGLGLVRDQASCGPTTWEHTGLVPGFESDSVHSENGGRNAVVFYSGTAGTQLAADVLASQAVFCRLPFPATAPIIGPGGLCVDVPHSNTADGTRLQLYTCNGTGAQSWTRPGNGTLRALGKCIDVSGSNSANGTAIQLWTCNGTAAQQWRALPSGALLNLGTGKCLATVGGGSASGTLLQLWTCNGTAAERFSQT
jgi:D-alanyl-D-alanine carboxypeptidase